MSHPALFTLARNPPRSRSAFFLKNRFGAGLAAALLAVAAVPACAKGATQFIYSPLFCKTDGGQLWIHPSGQIGNKSTTESMRVFYPLIHEAKHDHSGKIQASIVQGNRDIKGNNGKVLRVECRAQLNHPHGNPSPPALFNPWEHRPSKSNGVGIDTITLDGAKFIGGSHMLECTLPPRNAQDNSEFDGESRLGSYKSGLD
jgi:hypothetical protein